MITDGAAAPAAGGGRSVFPGNGEMASRMRDTDWAAMVLGPVEGWSASLQTAVGIALESRFPMLIWWGPELTMLYNDAYISILGDKHPAALGRAGSAVWADVWPVVGGMLAQVMGGGPATYDEDLLLAMTRRGFLEEAYFTFSYSPVRDETGGIGGVFTAVTETTDRVLGERRLRLLRALGEVTAVTAPGVEQACAAVLRVLGTGRTDVPFASLYLLDEQGHTARRAGFYGMTDDPKVVPVELDRDRDAERPVWAALSSDRSLVLTGLAGSYGGLFLPAGGPMDAQVTGGIPDPDTAVAMALTAATGTPVGVLFAGVSPYRGLDENYRQFLDLVRGQVEGAIADATAYQAQRRRARRAGPG